MLVRSFLILSILLLSGCKDPIPITKKYIPYLKFDVVQEYNIDPDTLNETKSKQFPVEFIDEKICYLPEEDIAMKKWALRQQQNCTCSQP